MSEPVPLETSVEFAVRRLLRPTSDAAGWREAVAGLDPAAAVPVLAAILERASETEDARVRATTLLGQLGGPGTAALLARHATEGETGLIRARSVLALAAIGAATPEARAAVAAALDDPDPFVRESAARVAGHIALDEAAPVLERMHGADPVQKNREEAAAALAALRGEG